MKRNPPWNRDEEIVALYLYQKYRAGICSELEAAEEASRVLRALPRQLKVPDEENFRNINGVKLRFGNFKALDETYSGTGMANVGIETRAVWEEFHAKPSAALSKEADAIMHNAEVIRSLLSNEQIVCERDGVKWTREETMAVFGMYFILPKNKFNPKTQLVIVLANGLQRKPGAVVKKLWNIAAHDPNQTSAGKSGLAHGSKYDKAVWDDYYANKDAFLKECVALLDKKTGRPEDVDEAFDYDFVDLPEGIERQTVVAQRVNQQYFRNSLMENYQKRCCLTGIAIETLLVASHIKPWKVSDPKTERLAPSNGLLLNAFHDKAFDKGLITIDKYYRIKVSNKASHTKENQEWLWKYEGREIEHPTQDEPGQIFIEYHNDMVFQH